jgi:hypothetical protein
MFGSVANFRPQVSVRWPFRFLAGVIAISIVFVVVGYAAALYMKRMQGLPHNWMVALPGILMLMRYAYYAAAYGRTPIVESWPFASDRVVFWYFVVLVAACYDQ